MSTSNDLILENLSVKAAGKLLLQDVSLCFEAGQIYTIIGPSGTGKSTLLNTVAGLIPKASGTMRFGDTDYLPKQHVIGLVPQNYGLLPWETAWKTVTTNVKICNHGSFSDEDEQNVRQLFEKLELTEVRNHYPKAMSGGQQQRVSLARAFAINGDFLLMDEPFSALDAFTREKTQALFLNLWQEHPQTTLFITHEIEEALLLGQKIVIMGGQPGNVRKLIDNPVTKEATSLEERRNHPQFYQWVNQLRGEIQSERSK